MSAAAQSTRSALHGEDRMRGRRLARCATPCSCGAGADLRADGPGDRSHGGQVVLQRRPTFNSMARDSAATPAAASSAISSGGL